LFVSDFVAAHGVLELPSIFIAGGAGLELRRDLFFPEFFARRDLWCWRARECLLVLGRFPFLVVAGVGNRHLFAYHRAGASEIFVGWGLATCWCCNLSRKPRASVQGLSAVAAGSTISAAV